MKKLTKQIGKILYLFLALFCIGYAFYLFYDYDIENKNIYNPEKHTCLDYGCYYMDPFSESNLHFTLSEVQLNKCPEFDGEYCIEHDSNKDGNWTKDCIPIPFRREECVLWE